MITGEIQNYADININIHSYGCVNYFTAVGDKNIINAKKVFFILTENKNSRFK